MAKNFLIGILLVVLGALSLALYQNKLSQKQSPSPPTPTIEQTPVTQTPSVKSEPTLQPTTENIDDLALIKKAMAQKHNKAIGEVETQVTKKDEKHAWGNVRFDGEMGGGWFLAYKKSSSEWIIVADGNGIISCADIAPYDFSNTMVTECVDKGGNLIKR